MCSIYTVVFCFDSGSLGCRYHFQTIPNFQNRDGDVHMFYTMDLRDKAQYKALYNDQRATQHKVYQTAVYQFTPPTKPPKAVKGGAD